MFKNYFRTAFRNLWKNKTYSFLNIFGLSIGISCAALIFLWVEDERNYNHNFVNRDDLYRVMQNQKNDGKILTNGSTPAPLAQAMKMEISGIRNTGRLSWDMDELLVQKDKSIKESGVYADASILSMLALPFIYGNADAAFRELHSVVISESCSKKLFGDANPVGKTIKMNINGAYSADGLYGVTGVYKNLPKNSSFQFQWISPYEVWEIQNPWVKPWGNNILETLVQLYPAYPAATINKKLENYLSTKLSGAKNQLFIFSMNDWNLKSNFENGKQVSGKIKYVQMFSLIAGIILLIACINFMNLSTARSEQRAREVGVLKVMGARKSGLISKFTGESLLMSFMAVGLAVIILYLLLPSYNLLVKKQLSIDIFKPLHLICLLSVGILAGIVAGSYPAFYLSSFNPITVLKNMRIKSAPGVIFIRKGLVITQFTVSISLIICTVVIYQQVQHIKSRDIGYTKDNLISMDIQGAIKDHITVIVNNLKSTGYVENAATSLHSSLEVHSSGDGYSWEGKDPDKKITIHSNVVSPEYISTMHMTLIGGRDFYSAPGTDSTGIIINESMARLMGRAGKPGSIVISGDGRHRSQVVGVIKDFVYNNMYGAADPLILFCGSYGATQLTVRYKPNADLTRSLAKTESVMKADNPGYPFEYKFVDEEFNRFFATETLIGKLAGVFAILAIFISCLGLFGLSANTAERRTKEIGIRKVLGASARGLVGLLSKDFLQLVALSCIIAFPLAWWTMHSWLQDYEYRTAIHWWVFVAAALTSLAIALITVSFQAVKAAVANPVRSLRME